MSVRAPPVPLIRILIRELIAFLTQLSRLQIGPSIRITSWWRDAVTNRRVGGHPQSQHLLGLAIDLVGEESELRSIVSQVGQLSLGVEAIRETGHLHIQWLPAGQAASAGLFDRVRVV
ncbi:MAG: D-Ala-D-Ala carboxypeptidase family metallohydrolase [Myxococcota bacterium]